MRTTSQEQALHVDLAEEKATAKLLPRSPLLSSHTRGWEGILVQHHQQPAWEMPVYAPSHHTLSIHHSSHSTESERVLDGKWRTEHIHQGDVALIPANVPHQKRWRRDCSFTLLMLDPTYVARFAEDALDGAGTVSLKETCLEMLPQFAKSDPLLYQIGVALKSELETEHPSTPLYIDSLITALTAHLIRHYSTISLKLPTSTPGLSPYQLERAIAYINADLTQELNLVELAAVAGISKFYFCRLFKQSMGTTPHQYVLQQRVERAKQLLKQHQNSIADVALQCGFTNQSHLNRHFKRLTGITPLAFLKQ
jgi:AraC family transcriptional regulator